MAKSASEPLAGRTVLITGASRGIGAAVARGLAGLGAEVILVARTQEPLEALAREIGRGAKAIPCDVSNPVAILELIDIVLPICDGAPDIIVNNAGLFHLAPLHEMPVRTFHHTLQTNLMAPFLLLREFLGPMRDRRSGHVITVGSIADRTIMPENGAYSAAKYGLRAMHEVLRLELRGTGVRATLISPGPVDTPLWDAVLEESPGRTLPARDVMLNPTAVAAAVVYAVTQPAAVNIDELRLSHS
jgi:NADP-dependent 3-hydroxy acid dehydrogenase YdfG